MAHEVMARLTVQHLQALDKIAAESDPPKKRGRVAAEILDRSLRARGFELPPLRSAGGIQPEAGEA